MSRSEPPGLGRFDYSNVMKPHDGILYLLQRSGSGGEWWVYEDEDMALQAATGYPVGELVEYERAEYEDGWDPGEDGELRAVFIHEFEIGRASCRERVLRLV